MTASAPDAADQALRVAEYLGRRYGPPRRCRCALIPVTPEEEEAWQAIETNRRNLMDKQDPAEIAAAEAAAAGDYEAAGLDEPELPKGVTAFDDTSAARAASVDHGFNRNDPPHDPLPDFTVPLDAAEPRPDFAASAGDELDRGRALAAKALRRDPFAGRIMWVWNSWQFNPNHACAALRRMGFTGVSIKIANGLGQYVRQSVAHAWHLACVHNGLDWLPWVYAAHTQAPGQEGHYHASLARSWHAEGLIVDAEIEYEQASAGTSAAYCASFRHTAPHLAAELSSFGLISLHSLDWGTWSHHHFGFRPQAYTILNGILQPSRCVAEARRVFAVRAIHPDIAVEADNGVHADPHGLRHELDRLPSKGWGVWDWDSASTNDIRVLGR